MSDNEITKRQEKVFSEIALKEMPREGGSSVHSAQVLEQNRRLRENGGASTSVLDWGYVALVIPPAHMRVLRMRYPDLASPDPEVRKAFILRFMRMPESEPYKVRKNDGRVIRHI